MISISIIIPVYNVEQYLSKCIDSIINQQIVDIEILLINDGSTDSSGSICNKYAKNDKRIKVFHQQNNGVSVARNVGIENANGNWICFVDADDTIQENSLSLILIHLKKSQNELTILNSVLFRNSRKWKEVYVFPSHLKNKIVSGEKLFLEKYLRGSVCGVVFNRNFLNKYNLRFPEDVKNGEDSMFMTFCFMYAQNIQHFSMDFYQVNIREESASRSWSLEKVKHMLNSLKFLETINEDISLSNTLKAMIFIKAYGIISNSLYHFFSLNKINEYPVIKSMIKKSKMYPVKTFGVNHFKFKILLLNFSIDLFCLPFFLRQQIFNMKRILN